MHPMGQSQVESLLLDVSGSIGFLRMVPAESTTARTLFTASWTMPPDLRAFVYVC